MRNIAIFASGTGTNAENLMAFFQSHPSIRVAVVVTNRAEAGVLERAKLFGVPELYLPKPQWEEQEQVLSKLREYAIDYIVLAGFLLKIPPYLVEAYENRILNIHPALLPKFGGNGMYGIRVHEAVLAAGEPESGITIHLVNEAYDDGAIVFQASVKVDPIDTPDQLANKIHKLEYAHFPRVVEAYIKKEL